MGLHSKPAGSEANESSRFRYDGVSCRVFRNERADKCHRSKDRILRSGGRCRHINRRRTGLVQQTSRLRSCSGSDVQTGSDKCTGCMDGFHRGPGMYCRTEYSAVDTEAFSGPRNLPKRLEVVLPS